MKRRVRLAAVGLLWAALGVQAQEADFGLRLTGLAGAPMAGGDEPSGRVAIEPSAKWQADEVDLRARARLRWLKHGDDERTDVDVRELTLAWRRGDATLTLGAQQLNWGRMDILRVTDAINPVDQHDLFHHELPEAKLALWMGNLEWQAGTHTLQLVATPQVPVDRLPRRVGGLPVDVSKPDTSMRNATVAARYGFEALGWNADVVAIKGWQATPHLLPAVGSSGVRLQGTLSRQDSAGFSADKPLGPTVLRIEGLVGRSSPEPAAAAMGVAAGRHAALGVGLDVRAGEWFLAGQVIGQRERGDGLAASRTAYVSAIVQRKWLQDRLSSRVLHIRETRSSSSWSSMQASYELSPHQLLQIQGDWFRGEPSEAFGSFRQRSRMALSLRLEF